MIQKSLFAVSNLSEAKPYSPEKKIKSSMVKNKTKSKVKLGKSAATVSAVIGRVKMGETVHYVSNGEWSMHDLLFHLISITGPARVTLCSWSISEKAVRRIIEAFNDNVLIDLRCVFDWRVKVRRPEVLSMVQKNIRNIALTACHAKVTVIENDDWSIAIIGSANYTNNPRIESGVIACDKAVAGFHREWMEKEIRGGHPFEDDSRKTN